MRTLVSVLVFSLLVFGPLSEQGMRLVTPAAAQSSDGERLQKVASRLQLTAEQRERARPVIEAGIAERQAILRKHGIKKGQRPGLRKLIAVRSELKAARNRTQTQLGQIFSPAQMKEYLKLSEELRAEMRKRYFE